VCLRLKGFCASFRELRSPHATGHHLLLVANFFYQCTDSLLNYLPFGDEQVHKKRVANLTDPRVCSRRQETFYLLQTFHNTQESCCRKQCGVCILIWHA